MSITNPNALMAALYAADWAAADAAPLRVWHEAQALSDGLHCALRCAILRRDKVAENCLTSLCTYWGQIYEFAYEFDGGDDDWGAGDSISSFLDA